MSSIESEEKKNGKCGLPIDIYGASYRIPGLRLDHALVRRHLEEDSILVPVTDASGRLVTKNSDKEENKKWVIMMDLDEWIPYARKPIGYIPFEWFTQHFAKCQLDRSGYYEFSRLRRELVQPVDK